MPSQSELENLFGQSLSRRDFLLLGTATAALFGLSRQDARAQITANEITSSEDLENNKPFADPAFENTWSRADELVARGQADRSWLWGPAPFTNGIMERYEESPGGQRLVQYFDKSRMEINDPNGDPNATWFVTNGLLARELMTGLKQVGNDLFLIREPARVGVAGDATWDGVPTYATLGSVIGVGAPSEQQYGYPGLANYLDPSGEIIYREDLGVRYGLKANFYVPETNHVVANVFVNFMDQRGSVIENGQVVEDQPLFPSRFYGTGFPLTEPYWTNARFADSTKPDGYAIKDVLVQAFERRTLTYTPDNKPPFQVEAGNIGRDYYTWSKQRAA